MAVDEALDNIELFSQLSKRERRHITRLMTPVGVKAGRVLTKEGDVGREFMIIIEGSATVRRRGRVLAKLGPGDFFGELAVVAGVPRTATVTADTEMVLETLNRREFSALLDESPALAKKILVGAVRRLHEIEESIVK
ncbi:MAG: cyclic nucleotide-binding domain-containing protein [Acidimicrobiales bacterium]